MTTILITNIVALNGGDGAILFGMIKSFRRAFGDDCRIQVYSSEPDVARRMFPEIEFRETLGLAATRAPLQGVRYLGRILQAIQQARYLTVAWGWARGMRFLICCLPSRQGEYLAEYAHADLVASSGGTYLKEEYGMRSQLCDYRLTLLLKRPLVFFTQSLGPFTRPDTKRAMKTVFSKSSSILLRDERSRRNIQDLGITGIRIHLAADAAFALADPAILESAMFQKPALSSGLKIAISVRHWSHFATCSTDEGMNCYRASVAESVRYLTREQAEVTFISTCQGIPEYDDDSVEAKKIVALLDAESASRVKVVREFVRFEKLRDLLRDFDLCIATRMHMCILSLISGIPVLPIAYEFKTRELFTSLGMDEWVVDIGSISPSGLTTRLQAFQRAIPSHREHLFRRVLDLHYSALRAAGDIRDDLRAIR